MKIDVLTLFPQMFSALNESILGRAQSKNLININVVNIRDFSADKHKKCDDYTFGGGAGMVMMPQPVCDAFDSLDITDETLRIFMSPKGKKLDQQLVKELSEKKHLVLLCGHYEGVDARIYPEIDLEISLGDFILTGGELAACVMIDALTRLQPGTFAKQDVTAKESFEDNLLEAPQYTRPEVWRRRKVPAVLLSGNHKEIEEWKLNEALKITKKLRPDLLDNRPLKTSEEKKKRLKRRK